MNLPRKLVTVSRIEDVLKWAKDSSVDYIELRIDTLRAEEVMKWIEENNKALSRNKSLILVFRNWFEQWKHSVYKPELYNKSRMLEALYPLAAGFDVEIQSLHLTKNLITKAKEDDKFVIASASYPEESKLGTKIIKELGEKAKKSKVDFLRIGYKDGTIWETIS